MKQLIHFYILFTTRC